MMHLFAALFFSVATILAVSGIAHMLLDEWTRVSAILTGEMFERAQARASKTPRVKTRAWVRAEPRLHPAPMRAAA